jgi:hypothetical protein
VETWVSSDAFSLQIRINFSQSDTRISGIELYITALKELSLPVIEYIQLLKPCACKVNGNK